MTLQKQEIAELKADLMQLKEELEDQAAMQAGQGMDTDEVTFGDNHIADYASQFVDKQRDMAEEDLTEAQLREVNEALERIKNGSYGICVDTGKEIPFERLKALPYAKRTVQAEEDIPSPTAANDAEDPSRLRQSKEQIEDSRNRIFKKTEEEHK